MRFDKTTLDRMEYNESLVYEVIGEMISLQRNDLVCIPNFSVVCTLLSHTPTDYLLRIEGEPTVVMQCANTLENMDVSLQFDEQIRFTTNQLNDPTEELAYQMTQNFIPMDAVLSEVISLALPMRVVKEDVRTMAGEGWQIIDPDEMDAKEQSPFANLSQKLSE